MSREKLLLALKNNSIAIYKALQAFYNLAEIIDFVSPLTLEECCRLLRSQTDDYKTTWFGKKPLVGRLDGTTFMVCKRIQYRNSFQPYLSGKMAEQAGGTHIHCKFSLHPTTIAILTFGLNWGLAICGIIFLYSLAAIFFVPFQAEAEEMRVFFLIIFGGVAGVMWGRYIARNERQFLMETISETLNASLLENNAMKEEFGN